MNLINPGGLLWFDDDGRRPIQQKIAEAVQRYRERVGYEPTICQLNPAQAAALEASANSALRSKRVQQAPVAVLPASLKLVPSDLIQPHCYLVGIAEGEQPRAAHLPYRDDVAPGRSTTVRKSSPAEPVAAAVGSASRPASSMRRGKSVARRVHTVQAVQPTLIAEALHPAVTATPTKTRGARRQKNEATVSRTATPAAKPKAAVVKSVEAKPATVKPATVKPAKATQAESVATPVPASFVAVAPVKATSATRRSVAAKSAATKPASTKPASTKPASTKKAAVTAQMLPLPEILPSVATAKAASAKARRSSTPGTPASGTSVARKPASAAPVSAEIAAPTPRTRKRSA